MAPIAPKAVTDLSVSRKKLRLDRISMIVYLLGFGGG